MTYPDRPAQEPEEPGGADERPKGWRALVNALSPKAVWAMADGQPVVLKQFVQFCLIIVYPGWVLGILGCLVVHGLFYVTVYPVLWVLFWPMRAWMKKNRPQEYAESQRKK